MRDEEDKLRKEKEIIGEEVLKSESQLPMLETAWSWTDVSEIVEIWEFGAEVETLAGGVTGESVSIIDSISLSVGSLGGASKSILDSI